MGSVGGDTLKPGWTRVAFGDVVRQVKDRVDPDTTDLERYVAGEHMDTDELRIRRWGVIGDGYLGPAFHMHFRPGHVLYGSRRTYLRKVAVADFEGITANTTFVIEPKDPKVLMPELLPFIMQTESFHEHSIKQSKGSVNPYINFSDLTWYEFALPPLDEQRRIASLLRASESTTEALGHLLTTHKRLRRAAIDAVTENETWPEASIGDVCSMQNGRAFPGAAYGSSGIRLMRPGNLSESGYLTWHPLKTVGLSSRWKEEASEFIVAPGDVVMNLTAQSLEDGFMGRVCLARNADRSLLNQRIGRFCAWKANILPEYVFRVFQTTRFRAHAITMCEGSKVKHIFWPYISRYVFRLAPLREQEAVVSTLREVDGLLEQLSDRVRLQHGVHQQLVAATVGCAASSTQAPALLR